MALLVEFKTVLLKEKIRFVVVPESLMMLLEPMLTYGELPQRNAEGADCVSRTLPVVSFAGGLALEPAVSTAVASSGTRLLRVLAGGHSSDRGGCSGAGVAACSSGVERLRCQACSSLCDLVGVFDSLSSHHVDRVRSQVFVGDGDTNSCWDTHAARATSRGLHSA